MLHRKEKGSGRTEEAQNCGSASMLEGPAEKSEFCHWSGKFPRFLAWQESLICPPVPSHFPHKTGKLHAWLLSRGSGLCRQTHVIWNVSPVAGPRFKETEGGLVWSFQLCLRFHPPPSCFRSWLSWVLVKLPASRV